MKNAFALLLCSCLLITGCDGPTDVPAPKTEEPRATPFDTHINALEKAKQLEEQMQQDEETRRRQLEQATQ